MAAPSPYRIQRTEFWGSDAQERPIYAADFRGMQWDDMWTFPVMDQGAAALLVAADSPYDGLMINIAVRGDSNVHPWLIVISRDGTYSYILHNGRLVAERYDDVTFFTPGQPTWVWFRMNGDKVDVGLGDVVGENTIMRGQTHNRLGGGYQRFALGRTSVNAFNFVIHDVVRLHRAHR
jgi:hypothetical protein